MQHSSDPPPPKRKERRRLLWISLSLFFLFSLLTIQFYRLQIVEEKKWVAKARAQHQIVVSEPFKRGVFYSNTTVKEGHPQTSVPLVVDVPKFHLFADPLVIPERFRNRIAEQIAMDLHIDSKKKSFIRDQLNKRSRSRKLVTWISNENYQVLERWWQLFARKNRIPKNALYFVREYQRSYPFGSLLGQVLHTVRENRDEITKQSLPTGGLEMQFDKYLQGAEGKRIVERSPKCSFDTDRIISEPVDGADVHLTINHFLQAIAEEELEKGVKKVGAKGGWAVMMDPKTGHILAMAQYPFFEPANYRKYYNSSELIDNTRIKAISDCFEPGSTFKAVTGAIGLMANQVMERQGKPPLFDPEEMVNCSDGRLPGRRPLKDVRLHRFLNFDLAIQKSSNIYMARIVDKIINELGIFWYREQLANIFGIGKRTSIELPYENPGMLPTPGKVHPGGGLEWSTPTPYSLAMGYNLMTNGIQMLRVFSIFANGGYRVEPTLIKKIVHKGRDGKERVLHENPIKRQKVMDPELAYRIVYAMKYVTKPGGAAPLGDIHGYTEAGKTSTSEKIIGGSYSKDKNFASFIGFAPAFNPRIMLIVAVDEPEKRYIPGWGSTQFGGKCSAPIFREISRRSLEFLGVPQDDPHGFPVGDPRYDQEKADWMLHTKALSELYKQWNRES